MRAGVGGAHLRALGGVASGRGPEGRERVRLLRRPALRERAAPLRPPPHRLREGHRTALPDDARPPRRASLRLGLPRTAGRDGGREGARHLGACAILEYGIERFNDHCHRSVLRYTEASGRTPSARGALGRLPERLQDAWTCPTWRACSGRSSQLWDGGLLYEDYKRHALLVGGPDAALELRDPHGRRLPRATGPRDHRALRARSRGRERAAHRSAGLDDHALDPALEPRPRRGPDHRLRDLEQDGRRTILGEALAREVRGDLGGAERVGSPSGARARGRGATAALPLLRGHGERLPGARGRLRRYRGGHRRRAPGARLRRGRHGGVARPGHRRGRARWTTTGCFTSGGRRLRGPARSTTPTRPIIRDAEGRAAGSVADETLRPQLPPLLAHGRAADLPGHELLVRARHRPEGAAGAQLNQQINWIPEPHPRRPLRQVARRTPATGRSAATASGARRSPSGRATIPRLPAHRRLRQPRRARARLRRAGRRPPPPLHRRARAAESRRPDGQEHHAARAGRARLLVRERDRCPSPRCTTPSRTRSGSRTTSPPTSSSSTLAQTRGWFYTMFVLDGALRPASLRELHLPRRRCWPTDGQKLSQAAAQLPGTRRSSSSTHGIGRDALVSCVASPVLRGRRPAHRERRQADRRGRAFDR